MENAITVMKRYEYKYILTPEQVLYLKDAISSHMKLDKYGLTSIASIYYDTPDYRIVRNSIEKPIFKEKLRLRTYGIATKDSKLFLEIKRKYKSVVYKRRIVTNMERANMFILGKKNVFDGDQISREIQYFRDFYDDLRPSCMIIYDREAYYEENGDLRLTIDANPRYRDDDFDLTHELTGHPLLGKDMAILEVKIQASMPLWLSKILDEGNIYKSSFSKYGKAYSLMMENKNREELFNV